MLNGELTPVDPEEVAKQRGAQRPPEDTKEYSTEELKELAKELKNKGLKVYGTDKCGWTVRQKELFKDVWDEVEYVNCETEKELCQRKSKVFQLGLMLKENYILDLNLFKL